ncbi:MAG: cell division protein FtsZ, partial [Proteobacteria bacterium]|nr:cell division protein FtsZ [Pseudomonadota bacterium]
MPYSSFHFSRNGIVKNDSKTIETPIIKDKIPNINVIGVGGAGGNAINHMIDSKLRGVNFIAANTDAEALEYSKAQFRLQIGEKLTEGLGAGANPQIGREAALESEKKIRKALKGSDMVFIVAGLGGGTGTGAAPVIAGVCKDIGALTVAVVTMPLYFEGEKRISQGIEGMNTIKGIADTVITIPNDRLRGIVSKNAKMVDMFRKTDEILLHSVKGITDLIMMPGLVNLDFANVRKTMLGAGIAFMGTGTANGANRAKHAVEKALSHSLLEDISITNTKNVLMNITAAGNITIEEINKALDFIYNEAGNDVDIIWGAVFDESLNDE